MDRVSPGHRAVAVFGWHKPGELRGLRPHRDASANGGREQYEAHPGCPESWDSLSGAELLPTAGTDAAPAGTGSDVLCGRSAGVTGDFRCDFGRRGRTSAPGWRSATPFCVRISLGTPTSFLIRVICAVATRKCAALVPGVKRGILLLTLVVPIRALRPQSGASPKVFPHRILHPLSAGELRTAGSPSRLRQPREFPWLRTMCLRTRRPF
jgi:hypothetical protein